MEDSFFSCLGYIEIRQLSLYLLSFELTKHGLDFVDVDVMLLHCYI